MRGSSKPVTKRQLRLMAVLVVLMFAPLALFPIYPDAFLTKTLYTNGLAFLGYSFSKQRGQVLQSHSCSGTVPLHGPSAAH